MTKRVNHVISSPNQSSTAVGAQKKDESIPPLLNSGLNPSVPPPLPPIVAYTKEDTMTKTQDDMTKNPENGVEEPESRTFDQVLASLTELTEKHCETVQVNLYVRME